MATEATSEHGASPETATPRSVSGARGPARPAVLLLLVAVAVVVVTADRLSKVWALAELPQGVPVRILGDLLIFQRVDNSGAAFSIASGSTWVFSIIASGVVLFLIWFARRIRSVAWGVLFGLLLGGTLGNLIDRLTRPPAFGLGHVVDFIRIPVLQAIFNVADTAIVSSMCLFVLLTLLGVGLDGSRRRTTAER